MIVLALTAMACSPTDDISATAGEPTQTVRPSAPTATAARPPQPTAPPEANATSATAVESLYNEPPGPGGWPIDAGPWISHSFSKPLSFELPVDGSVINDGAGRLEIAVGDPDLPDGFLTIVEPLAILSPTGAIPIDLAEPDKVFETAEILEDEVIELDDRTLRVYDARFPASPELAQFRSTCDRNPDAQCLTPFETLGSFVFIEQELVHRFVAQDWAGSTLVVVATPLDGADEIFLDHADALSRTVSAAPDSAHDSPRWITTLGTRGDNVPAGRYVARVGDTGIEISLDVVVPEAWVSAQRPTVVGIAAHDGADRVGWLRFFDFDEFIDAESATPTGDGRGDPLTAAEFEAGLRDLLLVDELASATVGGDEAIQLDATAEQGIGESCALVLGSTDPEATCVRWTRMLNPYWIVQASDVVSRHYYLEEADLLVVVTPESGFTIDDVLDRLGPILDGLTITTRPA